MPDVDVIAVVVAAAASFLLGGAYYALWGEQLAAVSGNAAEEQMPPWKLTVELLRNLVLAAVVAGIAAQAEIDSWAGGLLLGLALWVGFPFVLWIGALIHESTPLRQAMIHAGDWLAKLLALSVLVSVLQ